MRNTLFVIGLSVLVISCSSQKPVKYNQVKPKPTGNNISATTKPPAPPKPAVKHEGGYDFYRVNIADPTKNDNTISYGSIVSANPAGYHVVNTYFPAVAQNFRQKYIILHYTALDDDKSVTVLTQQSVSAHYLVNSYNDREIYQLVDENKRAYHAGISSWRSDRMLNDTSIGIEIVNAGFTTDASGQRIFRGFDAEQIKKVAALVKDIANRYMIAPTNILGHSDIAPTRKQDPGPKFPWKQLYDEYQIGMWYDEAAKQNFLETTVNNDPNFSTNLTSPQFIYKYQVALQSFGYDIVTSGSMDEATKKTIEAFQYHFRPEKCDGMMDGETWAILQSLNQKYPSK
ncbi:MULTISPECIES: N-acetylmuramoyl-L-alanine amidase [Chryseobacterium]|uniref:N-acetylmuramoyl-L-alanine amidase n=1 Tax=Chryseobacterium sp. R2A-55 TaxID=2744445 RepID=UPI001F39406E|nr:N-acetylmuramoyl-L-alanine amidase [Chryseobacterium sp. R2A-55]